ncbi:MAG TPA: hypothetical protein VNJ07_10850, partial [Chitinophagales bacterium]|nr:hypothetical protein [Chitinophagales bacterium]
MFPMRVLQVTARIPRVLIGGLVLLFFSSKGQIPYSKNIAVKQVDPYYLRNCRSMIETIPLQARGSIVE